MNEVIKLLENNFCSYTITWHQCTTGDSYKIVINHDDHFVSGNYLEELISKIEKIIEEE